MLNFRQIIKRAVSADLVVKNYYLIWKWTIRYETVTHKNVCEPLKGLFLRWLSFIAVRAKLDYAFRYGCMCGTAAVPILLAFFDVVFEPTTGNFYRFTLKEHPTYDMLFFVYVGLAFGSGNFIEHPIFATNSNFGDHEFLKFKSFINNSIYVAR